MAGSAPIIIAPLRVRPGTIGELERRAGLPADDAAARAGFWQAYAALPANRMLAEGIAELRLRADRREFGPKAAEFGLHTREYLALQAFIADHGRTWKAELRRQHWTRKSDPILLALLDRRGVGWLRRIREARA